MSREEKQPDNTSQPTEESVMVSQENPGGESAVTEMEPNNHLETDLESPPNLEEHSTDDSMMSATTNEGEAVAASELQGASPDRETGATVGATVEPELLEALKQDNEALKAQLAQLSQQYDAMKAQYMRIAADFDNFRKRTSKEKEELKLQAKRDILTELLPVADNFDRARSQIKPQNDGEMTIHKSYQGVYKQLVDSLKRLGVAPMRPEGQEFDPNLHEAVMRQPTDEYPEGVVMEQLLRGYFLDERVLRHAMVKVAAAVEPVVTSEEGTSENSEG